MEEFTQIIWILEPPDILILVFADEEELKRNSEEAGFFELPNEISLDAYLEKNIYPVKQYQKKRKETLEVEEAKVQQKTESTKEFEEKVLKLSNFEEFLESIQNRTESDQKLLEAIRKYKNSEKLKEVSQIKRNTFFMPVFLSFQS